jgi:hypothetical protein
MKIAWFQQSQTYARALAAMGARIERSTQTALLRRLPVLGQLRYVPLGQCTGAEQDLTVVNAPCPQQDAQWRALGAVPVMTPQWRAVLRLQGDSAMMEAMHGKWRNRLRAAMKGPLHLRTGPFRPDKHGWLLQHEALQRRQRGYAALPLQLLRHIPQDQTLLIEAHLNGAPVAAMLFVLHAPGATYHIGWSGPDGRAHGAHNLILWRAAQILAARGLTWLELGALDSQHTPGLTRFKLGSGAKPVQLGHTWLYLPRLSPLIGWIRRWGAFPSGLLRKGSIGGPRTSQDTPHGSAQHRHYRPR